MAIVKELEKQRAGLPPNKKRPRVDDEDGGIHDKVEEALGAYRETVAKLWQEQDIKSNEQTFWRADIEAAMRLKREGKLVNVKKQFGPIPGVKVGDEFHNRAELTIVGLHYRFRHGIDYMKKDGKILATSIVNSGRYSNRIESPDTLTYSGEGGNPRVGNKNPQDQKLERGNLALKNSMEEGNYVRVIRGFEVYETGTRGKKSYFTAYVYDGLYKVERFQQQREEFGQLVFKFVLRRIPGQPKITWGNFFAKSTKPMIPAVIVCKNDISDGKEKKPIRVINAVDKESPPSFSYIRNIIYPDFFKVATQRGCDCSDTCSESKPCPCLLKNGGVLSFNSMGTNMNSLVYECGTTCKCLSGCKNRLSQHGIQFGLEVFRTKSKGWGVRPRTFIPCGSFVCEYVGEIVQEKEARQSIGSDEYSFGTDSNYVDGAFQDASQPFHFPMLLSFSGEDGFVINATKYGNVGRFVNHSRSPNLFARYVVYDHDDVRMPHLMFFAEKNIPPKQELTFDFDSTVV